MTHQTGKQHTPRLVAAINVSPESFFGGSVARGREQLLARVEQAEAAGASMIDVGAMSTAPYKETQISEEEERSRMVEALRTIRPRTNLLLSADTQRAAVAGAALAEGADVVNDVSALTADPRMAEVVAGAGCRVILMANGGNGVPEHGEHPPGVVAGLLNEAVSRARCAGIAEESIILDPGIGFFRHQSAGWQDWDMAVLRGLDRVVALPFPVLVAASRKSFIGSLLGRKRAEDRLAGSLAVALWCAERGVAWLRVHDPAETRDAIRMWELLRAT